MERYALNSILEWKNSADRKPLVLKGARQTGKTWLMKEAGRRFYKSAAYFNFDEDEELQSIFKANKNPIRIAELLSVISGKKIRPHETLVILDEIQECPNALNSLKYFNENAGEYHIIAAGSLLGTLLAKPKSYPVGQINILEIFPLSFGEFLKSSDSSLYEYYSSIKKEQHIEEIFHSRLTELYHLYLITGGMPECVKIWINEKNPQKILKTQKELTLIYENDFSKHNGKINASKLLMVFRSIASQLAKENGKFIYGALKEGGRAREFEEATEWLVSAGMLNRAYNTAKMEHPLPAFDRLDCFKLYLFDTGLLKYMAGIDNKAILTKTAFQFKGALAENYVLQQLRTVFDIQPRYYSAKNSEIDFVIQNGTDIIPIEVKSGTQKKSSSFKRYITENNPHTAIRFSEMNYVKDGLITNIPLYLAGRTKDLI